MRRLRPRLSTLGLLVAVAAAGAWTMTLRPTSLGGPAGYVMVRGISMNPTYHTGDLVITRPQRAYRKGDIVAYRVPKGDVGSGIIVIHRLIGGSARTGYVVRGDNNGYADDWHPRPRDVVGKAWVMVPRAGLILAFLHAPVPLASLAAGFAVALVLVPGPQKGNATNGSGDDSADGAGIGDPADEGRGRKWRRTRRPHPCPPPDPAGEPAADRTADEHRRYAHEPAHAVHLALMPGVAGFPREGIVNPRPFPQAGEHVSNGDGARVCSSGRPVPDRLELADLRLPTVAQPGPLKEMLDTYVALTDFLNSNETTCKAC